MCCGGATDITHRNRIEDHFEEVENSLLGRVFTWTRENIRPSSIAFGLTFLAIVLGILNYLYFTQSGPQGPSREQIIWLFVANSAVGLSLIALIAWRVVKVWIARRRGFAGAKLHSQFVALFSLVSIIPAIFGISFAAVTFHMAAEDWFGERVETAVDNSVKIANAYLDAHARNIGKEVPEFARWLLVLEEQAENFDIPESEYQKAVADTLERKGLEGNFTAAYLLTGDGDIWAEYRQEGVPAPNMPGAVQFAEAENEILLLSEESKNQMQALVRIPTDRYEYLFTVRSLSPHVLSQVQLIYDAAEDYQRANVNLFGIQFAFVATYVVIAILVLLAAIWLGLWAATRLVSPIGRLVVAAEKVSDGDMTARVNVGDEGDEIATLGRTFNRMTGQLQSQRNELMEANKQFDQRRRFTEAVLSGVSAGVVGLTNNGKVTIANRSAYQLLDLDPTDLIDQPLGNLIPEMRELVEQAMAPNTNARGVQGQIDIARDKEHKTFNVRVSSDVGEDNGFVVTFDDITELVAAQRTSAWADVARRIAHEIKNPLTPIQLSAERLRRKYSNEVSSDPEVFEQCTETIIRQVGDIGRMVDEFSSFARMPAPVMKIHDISDITRQSVFMQKVANQSITYDLEMPEESVSLFCDGRLVSQALTNILKNAGEAVSSRSEEEDEDYQGKIKVRLADSGFHVLIEVLDNGCGLPKEHRHRLTEPYMTTRQKGTGLGLAIVRKVMEDHEGNLIIDDAEEGRGAVIRFILPHRTDEKDRQGDAAE